MPTRVLIEVMALLVPIIWSRPTRVGNAPKSAASNQTKAEAESRATMNRCGMVRTCSQEATGMLPSRSRLSRYAADHEAPTIQTVGKGTSEQAKEEVGEALQRRQQRGQEG